VTTDDEKSYGGDAIGSYGKDVSPLFHIHKGLPPMLIIQGTDDIVYEENKKLCAQSTTLGNKCDFIVYEGAPHGYFSLEVEGGKWYKQALAKADNFLTKAGYLLSQ
jgi:acetyl esterase/lipase